MSKKKLLLSCVALLSAVVATGAATAAPVITVGLDDMSCQAWSQSRNDPEQRKLYLAWIRGVLTGHNYANQKQQVSAMSSGTVENFVDRYCVQNPQGAFSDAALRMSDRFSGAQCRHQQVTAAAGINRRDLPSVTALRGHPGRGRPHGLPLRKVSVGVSCILHRDSAGLFGLTTLPR